MVRQVWFLPRARNFSLASECYNSLRFYRFPSHGTFRCRPRWSRELERHAVH